MLKLRERGDGDLALLPAPESVRSPIELRSDGGGGYGGSGLPNGGLGVNGLSPDGYAAAGWSYAQGYVYFPNLNTRRELSTYSRMEILRRSRWLVRNNGLARRLVRGGARMIVGTGLKPRPATDDKEWNALAQKRVDMRNASREILDVGGRWNRRQAQMGKVIARMTDGDFLTAFIKSSTGGARFRHYEGHQIGTYASALGQWGSVQPAPVTDSSWIDGVKTDRNNRAIKYRIFGDGPDDWKDVAATACSFYCKFETVGATRGASVFIHAIPDLLDEIEIKSAFKRSMKSVADKGYVKTIQNLAGNDNPGAWENTIRQNDMKVRDPVSGKPITLERLLGGGVIETLEPGQKIEVISDPRPHENQMEFMDSLIRSIAYGMDLAPELIWNIVKLGSAGTRYVLADALSWIQSEQQDLVDMSEAREYAFMIACDLASGALPPCKDPHWWKVGFITPPRITIDFTRDGKLIIDQIRSGLISPQTGGLMLGLNSYTEGFDRIDWVYEMKKYGLEKDPDPKLQVSLLEAFPGQFIGLRQDPDTTPAGAVDANGKPIPGAAPAPAKPAPKKNAPKDAKADPDEAEGPDDLPGGDPGSPGDDEDGDETAPSGDADED